MANYLCRYTGFKPVDRDVINVLVPTGSTYYPGQVVMLDALTTDISGNQQVWSAVAAATANLGKIAALVMNGSNFETMADGRRPGGNPDYTTYSYPEGEVAPAMALSPMNEFEISTDQITGVAAVGKYLEPVDGGAKLAIKDARTSGTKSALKILKLNKFRHGGVFGGDFIDTVIARVME